MTWHHQNLPDMLGVRGPAEYYCLLDYKLRSIHNEKSLREVEGLEVEEGIEGIDGDGKNKIIK